VKQLGGAAWSAAGLLAGLAAYLAWGFLPLYFRALVTVPPMEVLAHRVLGTAVLLAALLLVPTRRLAAWHGLGRPGVLPRLVVSAAILGAQWFVFIWAMSSGQLAQASLGSLLAPVVTALVGILFLKERPRPAQWTMLLLAGLGVLGLMALMGQPPGMAWLFALSYSGYAFMKKITPVDGITGLLVETVLLSPLALGWLLGQGLHGTIVFGVDAWATGLLLFAGLATAVPLLCFIAAAQRLKLTTLGVMQFIPPICFYLLGR
jgi:chloramphenicol-sensitive protein RarD